MNTALITPHPAADLRDRIRSQTLPFMACLLGCSDTESATRPVTFQTFDDEKPGGTGRSELTRVLQGSLKDHARHLDQLNQAGAGVFITVNGTDGRGRKKENLTTLRSWWADLDTKDAAEPYDAARLPLAPSMSVRTPGGWHLYWVAREPMDGSTSERRAEHEADVKAIAIALASFGGDLKACDAARVLRLPGFMHRKADPRLVEIVQVDGPRHTREQVRAAFPTAPMGGEPETRHAPTGGPIGNRPASWRERAVEYLHACEPSIQGQNGSGALFNVCLKLFTRFALAQGEVVELVMEAYNVPGRCEPPWSLAEVQHKAADANQAAGLNRGAAWTEDTAPRGASRAVRTPEAVVDDRVGPADPCQNARPSGSPASDTDRPGVDGFEWRSRGLFHLKPVGTGEDAPPPIPTWIAPPFTLPALVRNEHSDAWRLLIAWTDLDGIPHEAVVPFELLSGEGSDLARTLGTGGLVLPPDPGLRRHLLRYLCAATPKVRHRARLVETLGWVGGAFVLPAGEVIGSPPETIRYSGDLQGYLAKSTCGTLVGWQEGVARYAVGSPRLSFALACAFAGPLLGLVRPDGGGGFNLMGASSRGKTTCLECAASVWGRPDPLPTWRATSNGLEGVAGTRNDGFLVLDELSQVDPKEAGGVAYMLANGSAKARATKEGQSRTMRQWRLVFLSSGEQGLEDKLGEDGKRARAGQEVRVPDIPCPPEGMFREPHGFATLGALAEHLKAQARTHYGHAARSFLEKLAAQWPRRIELQARLTELESVWLASTLPPVADAQVRRVAGRFGLVAVAGELAQRMGILPWPEGESSAAAKECFNAWLDRRGFTGASEVHRGIEAVLAFLDKHGMSRFDEYGEKDARIINRAGTKKRSEGPVDGWDFFITPSAWKEACAGFSSSSVAKACFDAGIMEAGHGGKLTQSLRISGHGAGRYYVIRAISVSQYHEGECA